MWFSVKFIIIWLFLFVNNFDYNSKNHNHAQAIFKSKTPKMPIAETEDPHMAYQIYVAHGVATRNYLCKSIDGKTSRIPGQLLCNEAASKLNFQQNGDDTIISAKCIWKVMGKKDYYKHQEIRKNKIQNEKQHGFLMVACLLKNSKRILFHALHAKNNFYYIFDDKINDPEIRGCLSLTMQEFPQIEMKETRIPIEIDNIIGHYGILSKKDKTHVCQKIDKTNSIIVGEEICKKILLKQNLKYFKKLVSCSQYNIRRILPHDASFGWHLEIKGVHLAQCWYEKYENMPPSDLWIVNTTIQNYYYVARPYRIDAPEIEIKAVLKIE